MGVTVPELLVRADTRELTYWRAYEIVEPPEPKRTDYRFAVLVHCLLATVMKKGKALTPKQILDQFFEFEPKKPKSYDEMVVAMKAWKNMTNAVFDSKKKKGV